MQESTASHNAPIGANRQTEPAMTNLQAVVQHAPSDGSQSSAGLSTTPLPQVDGTVPGGVAVGVSAAVVGAAVVAAVVTAIVGFCVVTGSVVTGVLPAVDVTPVGAAVDAAVVA